MKVYVNVKQAGIRKKYITKQELVLDSRPETLRELIYNIVSVNARTYNNRVEGERIIDYLTNEDIKDRLITGRVSFSEIYNESMVDINKALEAAFQAYEDGIYRVFIGESETGGLNETIHINEGDILTFIRLTMLAGRLW